MARRPAQKHGLLLIDKQPDCTSHDVVQMARRLIGERKIGHCGTLDPSATGLLVLTVGRATRLTRFLIRAPKVYEGSIQFGAVTDTYDAAGAVVAESSIEELDPTRIGPEMESFEGTYDQRPPAYSAKKIKGEKYYELARRGEEVPTETTPVEVYEFRQTSDLAKGRIEFQLGCASGTYARSLAHDLGQRMGCGAHLSSLRRTRVGPFDVSQASRLDDLQESVDQGEGPGGCWLPFDQIPLPFGEVMTDPQQEERIVHGQSVLFRDLSGEEGDWIKLTNRRQQFIAVGTVVECIGSAGAALVQPRVVFK